MKGKIKLMKKLFNILLVLLLSMGIFTSNSVKVEAYDGSETDTTGWIQSWTHFGAGGNVEWAIDPDETLWIRPENGASVGTMGNISSTSSRRMPWYSRNDLITSVKIKSGTTVEALADLSYMFYYIGKTGGTIDLTGLDTSKVTYMISMFNGSRATTLDLSSFDTSSVTDMNYMFYMSKATTLDVSSFDTSKVTNMKSIFSESQATTLDVSSFDTSKVTNMSNMFYMSKATTLDVSSFDTSKVTNMSGMFQSSQATTLDLSSFDTSKVTNMSGMFYMSKATTLDVSSFDTSKVTDMSGMFQSSQATTLDLSSFDTSKVTDMNNMLYYSQVTKLTLSEQMNGDNGSRFSSTYLSGNDWVKVRDKNGNLTYDDNQFYGSRVRNLTESTTPKLSGTWVKKSSPEYQAEIDKGQEYISKQGINANNDWVKNGDTWTYTFDVFDDSIPYYIWEDKIPDYTSSVMKPNKDLMNQNGEKYYEIINRSTTLGSLNITKTTNNETEDRFEFTITLNGNGLEGTKVFSNVIFTDGVGKIKLGKDESKLIEGLPAGITYTVEETPYGDYTTTSTGATGTIVQGETQEASFNNALKHVEDATLKTGFKVKKVVNGNNEINETFDFIAQINTGEPNKHLNKGEE